MLIGGAIDIVNAARSDAISCKLSEVESESTGVWFVHKRSEVVIHGRTDETFTDASVHWYKGG